MLNTLGYTIIVATNFKWPDIILAISPFFLSISNIFLSFAILHSCKRFRVLSLKLLKLSNTIITNSSLN